MHGRRGGAGGKEGGKCASAAAAINNFFGYACKVMQTGVRVGTLKDQRIAEGGLFFLMYTRALHRCRRSTAPMLRVGQGSTSNCSILYLVE